MIKMHNPWIVYANMLEASDCTALPSTLQDLLLELEGVVAMCTQYSGMRACL